MIKVSREHMAALWKEAGISIENPQSGYNEMLKSDNQFVRVSASKIKKGFFNQRWIGDVNLMFSRSELFIGMVSADLQSEMWQQFREFIDFRGRLYQDTESALIPLSA